jgi:nitroreductase
MIRAYDPNRAVPAEALDAVLTAALRAPSAGHTQGVSFLVLRGAAEVEAYWDATAGPGEPDRWLRGMRTAPVLIMVWTSAAAYLKRYAEPDKGWPAQDPERLHPEPPDQGRWSAPYWFVDAGMASMAALLGVVDHELAACFFGVPPDRVDRVRASFGVPSDQLSVGVISVGYPDPTTASRPRAGRARRPPEERLHLGSW